MGESESPWSLKPRIHRRQAVECPRSNLPECRVLGLENPARPPPTLLAELDGSRIREDWQSARRLPIGRFRSDRRLLPRAGAPNGQAYLRECIEDRQHQLV